MILPGNPCLVKLAFKYSIFDAPILSSGCHVKIIFTVGFFIIAPISIKFPVSYNTSKSIVLKVSTSSTKLIPCLYPSLSSKDFKKSVTDFFPICDQLSALYTAPLLPIIVWRYIEPKFIQIIINHTWTTTPH